LSLVGPIGPSLARGAVKGPTDRHGPASFCTASRAARALNDFGRYARAYSETSEERTDLETVIADLLSGQYANPIRVVAFNTTEGWSADVSEDVAREIMRRVDLAGDELPPPLEAFVTSTSVRIVS
jgi:hypothetical protein